jgi:hypothetical protein
MDFYGILPRFSNIINSFLQYLPLSSQQQPENKRLFQSATPDIVATSGKMRRYLSSLIQKSTVLVDNSGTHYVYDLDTCQTIYLVEKHHDGRYEVTILYTKEVRLSWIEAKLQVILLRILIAEQNIPVLNEILTNEGIWRIIGSIDCQGDRSYSTNSFHQDSILSAFINAQYRPFFEDFLKNIFSPRGECFDPVNMPGVHLGQPIHADENHFDETMCPNGGFQVASHSTAHFGILDYDAPVPIIAAAVDTGTEFIFTILPASTNYFRPFLFYLNSIIEHATPKMFTSAEILLIIAYYTAHPEMLPPNIATVEKLREALNDYNKFFSEAQMYPRSFRRLLGKILPTEEERGDGQAQRIEDEELRITVKYKTILSNILVMKNIKKQNEYASNQKSELILVTKNAKKTVTQMTSELKLTFKTHATLLYVAPAEVDPAEVDRVATDLSFLVKMDTEFDNQPKNQKNLQTLIQATLLRGNPNYYVYASKIFTREEVEEIKHRDIVYEDDTFQSKRSIDNEDDTVQKKKGKTTTGVTEIKKGKKIQKETVKQIQRIRLPKVALSARAGGSRSKSRSKSRSRTRQKINTKKKSQNKKGKGRRTNKKKHNKRRTKKR